MYFQDGPAFAVGPDTDANVLATYSNGYAAVMVVPYGKGMVGVSGPHPEADQSWCDNADLVNPDGIRPDMCLRPRRDDHPPPGNTTEKCSAPGRFEWKRGFRLVACGDACGSSHQSLQWSTPHECLPHRTASDDTGR
jgi:hypothetical protein